MLESPVEFASTRGALIRETKLYVVDEATMCNRAVLACVEETCRRATSSVAPFGGKSFILLGDFRQTCPVIRKGNRAQVVDASIRSSPLWRLFKIFHLTLPIRNAADPEYADFVDRIGDGAGPDIDLRILDIRTEPADLIEFVFPDNILSDPAACTKRAILAPTNRQVDRYNTTIMHRVPGETQTFYAADSIRDLEGPEGVTSLCPQAVLDYSMRNPLPGLPHFAIDVKIGCVYRMLRNFSHDQGVVKNVRCLVTHIGHRLLMVHIIADGAMGEQVLAEDVLIPRINFTYTIPGTGMTLQRRQFPLGLAYATTFNSCQGLTLDRVGVELTKPVFSHGQLYVALSRIRQRGDGMVRLEPEHTTTPNITYPEILLPPDGA